MEGKYFVASHPAHAVIPYNPRVGAVESKPKIITSLDRPFGLKSQGRIFTYTAAMIDSPHTIDATSYKVMNTEGKTISAKGKYAEPSKVPKMPNNNAFIWEKNRTSGIHIDAPVQRIERSTRSNIQAEVERK